MAKVNRQQLIAVTHRGTDDYDTSTAYRDLVDDRYMDLRRPRIVTFYCNGDDIYPGIDFSITPNRYVNLESLMADIQKRVSSLSRLPNGVRRVYRVRDGCRILSIDELDDGEGYACGGREQFKPADYARHAVRGPMDRPHAHGQGGADNVYEEGGRVIVRPVGGYTTGHGVRMMPHRQEMILSERDRAVHVELERMRASLVERERAREHQVKKNQMVQWRRNAHGRYENPFKRIDNEREKERINHLRQKYVTEKRSRERFLYSRRAHDERLEVEAIRRLSARKERGPLIIQNVIDNNPPLRVPPIEYQPENERGLLRWLDNESMFYEKYRLIRQLGKGRFSTVHEAVKVSTGQECAVKIIDKRRMGGQAANLEGSVELMQKLDHPNIIRFYDAFETSIEAFLVLELVNGGDLFDLIVKNVRFDERQTASMITDLAKALEYIHSQSIAHRDLKPENIMVCRGGSDMFTLKLGDFELATHITSPIKMVCGTPTYVAPEILKETGYGVEVDCWALGVITFALLSGFPPFRSPERRPTELFEFIKAGEYEYLAPYWNNISKAPRDLIDKLLTVEPRSRYTAQDVLSHPWIKSGGVSSTKPGSSSTRTTSYDGGSGGHNFQRYGRSLHGQYK